MDSVRRTIVNLLGACLDVRHPKRKTLNAVALGLAIAAIAPIMIAVSLRHADAINSANAFLGMLVMPIATRLRPMDESGVILATLVASGMLLFTLACIAYFLPAGRHRKSS